MDFPEGAYRSSTCMRPAFGVDVDLVWDVVETKIPPLRAAVRRLLDDPELT